MLEDLLIPSSLKFCTLVRQCLPGDGFPEGQFGTPSWCLHCLCGMRGTAGGVSPTQQPRCSVALTWLLFSACVLLGDTCSGVFTGTDR